MGVTEREISDFNEGILHASRLTAMGRQINELTKQVNILTTLLEQKGGFVPAYFSSLTAVDTSPGVYSATATLPTKVVVRTDIGDSAGPGSPSGMTIPCYVTNVAERPGDATTHALTDTSATVPAFLGFLSPEFSSDGKRMGYCWGLDLSDCGDSTTTDGGAF